MTEVVIVTEWVNAIVLVIVYVIERVEEKVGVIERVTE